MTAATARWPARECLHENTSGPTNIVNGVGALIKVVRERCLDCRSRRNPDTGEWVGPS